jgi:hypothetical protein
MAKTWKLSEIRAEFRLLTGRSTTAEISDSDVNDLINDYYQNNFPEDAKVANFDTDFTQETSPSDSGEYSLSSGYNAIKEPVTINDEPILLYLDRNKFIEDYPDSEQYITSPTLAIGVSSKAAVLNAAFKYSIQGDSYSKSSVETALSGDNIPQSKYGAWSLKIDENGTITVTEADDNATGYLTAALAIQGLPDDDSDSALMGYVTAVNTAGVFIPGTTLLDAGGVTATYTNGLASSRNIPLAALIHNNKLFLRPKPDDIYLFRAASQGTRPSVLSTDTDVPSDVKWGSAIALGASILYLNSNGEQERVEELMPIFKYRINSIARKKLIQLSQRYVEPNF